MPTKVYVLAVLFYFAAASLSETTALGQKIPNIIFDTDFRADCDDVGALAVLHALADNQECQLLGITTSTTGPSIVAAIDAVNTFFGRPNLPIGLSPVPHTEHFDPFAPALAKTEQYPSDQTNESAPDAIALYRRLLHSAPDQSVKIVVVGYATCPALLLQTKANHDGDGIPFSGRELVQIKVTELVQMAGVRPGGSDTFNLGHDASAAVYVENHWPTKIVYSNAGKTIKAGAALQAPEINPVAKAFELYPGAGPRGTIGDRQCWDEIATLHAVRGGNWDGTTWWKESPPCEMTMTIRHLKNPKNKEKDTAVDVKISESSSGNRTYLIQVADEQKTAQMIEQLMTKRSTPANR